MPTKWKPPSVRACWSCSSASRARCWYRCGNPSARSDASRRGSTYAAHDPTSSARPGTAVSASGPAYVFYLIEALERAAREVGFDEAAARRLAIGTFRGAAELAGRSPDAPAILRERVTSKGGTTERAQHFRLHAATSGRPLTAQQPLNNVARITLQALAQILGGCEQTRTASFDEALGIPTQEAARTSIRPWNGS